MICRVFSLSRGEQSLLAALLREIPGGPRTWQDLGKRSVVLQCLSPDPSRAQAACCSNCPEPLIPLPCSCCLCGGGLALSLSQSCPCTAAAGSSAPRGLWEVSFTPLFGCPGHTEGLRNREGFGIAPCSDSLSSKKGLGCFCGWPGPERGRLSVPALSCLPGWL